MKAYICGDLHGKHEIVDELDKLTRNSDIHIVFVGDYLDSFDRLIDEQIKTIEKVMDLCDQGRATALYGNHEASYLIQGMRCSGYNPITQFHVNTMANRIEKTLKYFTWVNDILVSHAGVSQRILTALNMTLDEYLESTEDFLHIGYSRCGPSPVGGLLWCDWALDFDPIPGVKQIVGHSIRPGGQIATRDDSWCIDVLDNSKKVLYVDDASNIEIFEL